MVASVAGRVLVALALALPVTASAADVSEAKRLFKEGVALANQEKWQGALQQFEASYRLVQRPSTLFNIGSTLIRLGRPLEAVDRLEAFVRAATEPREVAAATELITKARAELAHLDVEVDPPDAELRVGRRLLEGTGRRTIALDPGTVTIEAKQTGFEPLRRSLALRSGARHTERLTLTPSPPPLAPAPPPPLASEPVKAAVVEETEPSILASPWLWVVVGAVVVAGATAGIVVGTRGSEDPYAGTSGTVLEL